MHTIIAGSRSIEDISITFAAIKESGFVITKVISGGAKGPDTHGIIYADTKNLSKIIMPANWDKFGRDAGFIRNYDMAEIAEALILVWDGYSAGSADMLDTAKIKKLKIFEKVIR